MTVTLDSQSVALYAAIAAGLGAVLICRKALWAFVRYFFTNMVNRWRPLTVLTLLLVVVHGIEYSVDPLRYWSYVMPNTDGYLTILTALVFGIELIICIVDWESWEL